MSHFPRLFAWKILTLLLLAALLFTAPQQLPVALYKLALIALAGVIGYWFDRSFFPYARPDGYLTAANWKLRLQEVGKQIGDADLRVVSGYELVFAAAMLRRALIVGACIIGMAMGL